MMPIKLIKQYKKHWCPVTTLFFIISAFIIGFIAAVMWIASEVDYPDEVVSPISEVGMVTPTPTPTVNVTTVTHTGIASYYSRSGCLGCSPTMTMANGEPLDDNRLTVAYNRAPLNHFVIVTNTTNGKSVRAKISDTGGFERHGRIIDLTIATRDAIGCSNLCQVEVTHE